MFLISGRVAAQSVTVEAKIDSLQILIGEQAKIQLQVAMDAKQRAVFPVYSDTLIRGVEVIETAKPDTPVSYTHLDVYKRQAMFHVR